MLCKRERLQVFKTIKWVGKGRKLVIRIPAQTDPLSGIPTGVSLEYSLHYCTINYNREELINPSIANGLMKILVPSLLSESEEVVDFLDLVENKSATVILPNGKEFRILHNSSVTTDGITPLVSRLFLGG